MKYIFSGIFILFCVLSWFMGYSWKALLNIGIVMGLFGFIGLCARVAFVGTKDDFTKGDSIVFVLSMIYGAVSVVLGLIIGLENT